MLHGSFKKQFGYIILLQFFHSGPRMHLQFQEHVWLFFWTPCHFMLVFFLPSELKRRPEHVCLVAHSSLGFKAGQNGRDGVSAVKRSHSATADLDLSGTESTGF